jgi:hypothetical protein
MPQHVAATVASRYRDHCEIIAAILFEKITPIPTTRLAFFGELPRNFATISLYPTMISIERSCRFACGVIALSCVGEGETIFPAGKRVMGKVWLTLL